MTYGRLFFEAAKAVKLLPSHDINAKVLKLNRIKPVDKEALKEVMNAKHIFFYEEGVRSGGIGEKFAAELLQHGYKGSYDITAVEDCFVKQAKVPELIKQYGFDSESMVNKIVEKTTEV